MTFDKEDHRQIVRDLLQQMRPTPNPGIYRTVADLMEAVERATIEGPVYPRAVEAEAG